MGDFGEGIGVGAAFAVAGFLLSGRESYFCRARLQVNRLVWAFDPKKIQNPDASR
jgi:hypothetical protein